ncbi:MAG TPA: chalcone isomerase family protein [Candidatus Aminicenantes bacterium]|nr:chalcone isomerase family protein [Candidatus Aminicenantes bacterium]
MTRHALLFLVLTGLFAAPLSAGTLSGVTLADTMDVDGHTLLLNGMALRKKVVFKVYVAGLYLPARETDGAKVLAADTPRCTVMHFLRSVSAKQVNEAWYDGLEANTPNHTPQLKKQFDELAALMEGFRDGDELAFTYKPGNGTEVKVKGRVKGTLGDKAFADALFACWIGPKPGPGEKFKTGLLGR